MPKFCNECGYKFDKEFKFCPECGTKVQVAKNNSSNKKVKNTVLADQEKRLEPKILYGILVGGIVVIAIILLTSGILDTTPVVNSPLDQKQMGNPSGVNLNNIQMINDLETKVKQSPEDYNSLLQLAQLKNDAGLFEASIQNYKMYLEKNPKDADARVDMGVCYFNLKDYADAIKEMETALKYSPKHQIAHLNLGVVNLSAGNIEKSKEWLKKAYELNPTSEVGIKAEQLLNNH